MELGDFLKKSGEYSHITVASLAFLLGIISALLIDLAKRRSERNKLIELFIHDIYTNWHNVSALSSSAEEVNSHRVLFHFRDAHITFYGQPEYEFEVYNLKFFETEGFKLLPHLSTIAKRKFWEVYTLIRDAEATRTVLKSLPEDHKDRASYQKVFLRLVERLSNKLVEFQGALYNELTSYNQLQISSKRIK